MNPLSSLSCLLSTNPLIEWTALRFSTDRYLLSRYPRYVTSVLSSFIATFHVGVLCNIADVVMYRYNRLEVWHWVLVGRCTFFVFTRDSNSGSDWSILAADQLIPVTCQRMVLLHYGEYGVPLSRSILHYSLPWSTQYTLAVAARS